MHIIESLQHREKVNAFTIVCKSSFKAFALQYIDGRNLFAKRNDI